MKRAAVKKTREVKVSTLKEILDELQLEIEGLLSLRSSSASSGTYAAPII